MREQFSEFEYQIEQFVAIADLLMTVTARYERND